MKLIRRPLKTVALPPASPIIRTDRPRSYQQPSMRQAATHRDLPVQNYVNLAR